MEGKKKKKTGKEGGCYKGDMQILNRVVEEGFIKVGFKQRPERGKETSHLYQGKNIPSEGTASTKALGQDSALYVCMYKDPQGGLCG